MTALILVALLAAGSERGQAPRAAAAKQPSRQFAAVVRDAQRARLAGRINEAIELYRKAVRFKPDWREGYWHAGTLLYDQDRCAEAREPLRRFLALEPQSGPGAAMLGLCDFQVGEYRAAYDHLVEAMRLGLDTNPKILQVTRYHLVLLHNKAGRHELAWPYLFSLAQSGMSDSPVVIQVSGLIGLRMPLLPSEIPPEKRGVVLLAGRAMWAAAQRNSAAAEQALVELVGQYPNEPNVHYMYGAFLLVSSPEKGIAELERELERDPEHVPSLVSLVFEYLKRDDGGKAVPYARRAVAAAPDNFTTHAALGRALLEAGDAKSAVGSLETAVRLAPDSPQVHFHLAAAYRKIGRRADADREQAEFLRLKALADSRPL